MINPRPHGRTQCGVRSNVAPQPSAPWPTTPSVRRLTTVCGTTGP